MAELKTQKTKASVAAFINSIDDPTRRKDCRTVLRIMKAATGATPKMWGASIVGLGDWRCRYKSGRECDWFQVGFASRKDAVTLYLMPGLSRHQALLRKLGKHKTGKGCLYVKQLADIDQAVLTRIIVDSVKGLKTHAMS